MQLLTKVNGFSTFVALPHAAKIFFKLKNIRLYYFAKFTFTF